ncbi:unnamed protein product [Heterobilharzia americana]|nr:unnamed protein product [Heterobilharzia americana]
MASRDFLAAFSCLPRLIVFDLDFTLWPLWCDTHVSPPFIRKNNVIYDVNERRVDVYPDSEKILRIISESPVIKLACASRTSAINVAQQLLRILGWSNLFDYTEIYPGSKISHFKRDDMMKDQSHWRSYICALCSSKPFHELSGIAYTDMLFFDDEERNINDISRLGVQCHLVERGLTLKLLEHALRKFQQSRS